jgi:hypothetical protein
MFPSICVFCYIFPEQSEDQAAEGERVDGQAGGLTCGKICVYMCFNVSMCGFVFICICFYVSMRGMWDTDKFFVNYNIMFTSYL